MEQIKILCLAFITAVSQAYAKEVSYPPYGTFSDDPPFHKSWMSLPQSPNDVGTQFFLFTNVGQDTGHRLEPTKMSTIRKSEFDPSKKTVFISHGYTGGIDAPMNKPMTAAFLQRGGYNVIVVAWKDGSHASYVQAAANCRLVGAQIGFMIDILHNETGLQRSKVHVVGYSLGAHVAAYTGSYMKDKGKILARITGLDPAAPLFEHEDIGVRLDKSDAEFVDVIHTNTQRVTIVTGIGMATPAGHIDFYVNGGARQPGCLDLDDGLSNMFSCSHTRSYVLFIESIARAGVFKAYPCSTYSEFLKGKCTSCPSTDCPLFGYDSIEHKGLANGNFYLKTTADSPFLVHHFKVTFKTGTAIFGDLIGGIISITLTGTAGASKTIKFQRRRMALGSSESFVAGIDDIGDITAIQVWHADPFQKWNVKKIMVQQLDNDTKYYACVDLWLNSKNNYVVLSKSNGNDAC